MSIEDSQIELQQYANPILHKAQELDQLLNKLGAVSEVLEAKKKLRECVMWANKAIEG